MTEKKLLENLNNMSVDEILDTIDSFKESLSMDSRIKALKHASHLTTEMKSLNGSLKRIEEVYQDFLESEAGDNL